MQENLSIRFIGDLDDDNHELWGDPVADQWHIVRYNRRRQEVVSWLPADLPDQGGILVARRNVDGVSSVSKGRTWEGVVSQLRRVMPTPHFEKTIYGEQFVWYDVNAEREMLIDSAAKLREEAISGEASQLSA
jgi:hypothetical protein